MSDRPGHPDELRDCLNNWLRQAADPIGSLPPGVTPAEWAVQNFIDAWRRPVRRGIESVEASLRQAEAALNAGDVATALSELDFARETLFEGVRNPLGLYDWDREDE